MNAQRSFVLALDATLPQILSILRLRISITLIYWIYAGYLLKISGNIDKNETVNLALSTKNVNLPKKS